MTDRYDRFVCPFEGRYAGEAMKRLLSPRHKFTTWRRLWLALAEAQRELGLEISEEQICQLRRRLDEIDFDQAERYERRFRHDVMAHIHAYGDVAPDARPILHLGATSQFVGCNTDILLLRDAMDLLIGELVNVIDALANFAFEHRRLPCLGFTHFQPAQPTTVGKRAALWCADFLRDLADLEYRRDNLRFRGVKGTTGTQASFLALFDGDAEKVRLLDRMVAERMGFARIECVTGQTYSRKVDAAVAQALAQIGVSVHKFANDVRLLAHRRELEEPFESNQVGSSAMAYKRNPMRCERATAIARFLIDLAQSPVHTASQQWLERTLDDSANKRLAMSECLLAADSILRIALNVARGLIVYPAVIDANLRAELPFLATENILMAAARAGGDRQELHERIRTHSQAAAARMKTEGLPNDLLDRLGGDEAFSGVDLDETLEPARYIGRAPEQVEEFIAEQVEPVRRTYVDRLGGEAELTV
jgi:adenylosuccinate lyase